jgi:prepilin-type N-terminal cleavage/methylation domain-containing protein
MRQRGFTIIELIVGMGVFLTLMAVAVVNLTRLPSSSAQSSGYDLLIADIKSQQTEAMVGALNGEIIHNDYGIYFGDRTYTLIRGNTYDPLDSFNFVVNLDPNISITNITFQNNVLIFEKGSGEVKNYSLGQDSLEVKNDQTGEVRLLRINKYGAIY